MKNGYFFNACRLRGRLELQTVEEIMEIWFRPVLISHICKRNSIVSEKSSKLIAEAKPKNLVRWCPWGTFRQEMCFSSPAEETGRHLLKIISGLCSFDQKTAFTWCLSYGLLPKPKKPIPTSTLSN